MTPEEMNDYVDRALRSDGVATVQTKDGRMIFFTAEMLRRLLTAAEGNETGRAVILIQPPGTKQELLS